MSDKPFDFAEYMAEAFKNVAEGIGKITEEASAYKQLIPAGKAMGCLPRKYKPGRICPMFRERFKVMTLDECQEYVGKISMRPYVKTILDQDGVGSCATEGTAGGIMICRAIQGLPHIVLNPWFIYHTTSHGRDQGSSIDENLEFARANGCAPESVWPRSKGWQAKPNEEAVEAAKKFVIEEFFDITTIEEAATAQVQGFPFVYGSKGHCVVKVEHLNKTTGLDLNSWAISWGDKGFGNWASYREINWGYGAYAVRLVYQG